MSLAFPAPDRVLGVETIPDALERAGGSEGSITIVDRELRERPIPYSSLAEAACRAAGALRRRGVEPGDRVCLLSPTSPDLLVGLFAAWRASAIPIVLPLPRRQSDLPAYIDDVVARVRTAGARLLAVSDVFAGQGVSFDAAGVPVARLEGLPGEGGSFAEPVRSAPDDPALLQFTSGTTARPRAVTLTHRQILSNLSAAGSTAGLTADDVVVSWLPLFHDMGLIGMLLGSVAFRAHLVLEPTEEFLGRPGSWLDAISKFRGTLTASPNFGYGLAARDLRAKPRSLDLTSWKVAANGAETVDLGTCGTFADVAGAYGFRREAMCPMFGLAEATLAVTLSASDRPPAVDWVERESIEAADSARPCPPGAEDGRPLVSCGYPIPGTEVRVVSQDGGTLPAFGVGEICVRGPSVMTGYWRDASSTADAVRDGWLHTGDLGFWGSDGLVICGRQKDVIILGGRNLYPEDYEAWTERVPGVRRGNVIAFAVPGAERMVVVAETTVGPDEAQIVARETLETLRRRLPRGPEEVVLVTAGTLPKTSSGKRQRGACRERYAAGSLETVAVAKR